MPAMTTQNAPLHESVAHAFRIDGSLRGVHSLKIGHINETLVSVWDRPDGPRRYVHQRINKYVFRDVPGLMKNVERVLGCLRSQPGVNPKETLTLVPTRAQGGYLHVDAAGEYWRTYEYLEGTVSHEVCGEPRQAYEAAKVVGHFLVNLSSLDAKSLVETIPMFHHVPNRIRLLREAVGADQVGRVREVDRELSFALAREGEARRIIDALESGDLPLRTTHNDLKFNNILFDQTTGRGVCVVDLDTCMPGSSLYDFGDLARSVVVAAREDERDLNKIALNERYFAALVEGYLESAGKMLAPLERELMFFAPRVLALALGVRFLTDYLSGDHYFKINYPSHNLDRARAQFKVVAEMEKHERQMRAVIGR